MKFTNEKLCFIYQRYLPLCCSTKLLSKSKPRSGSGFYFEFQYQNYILYKEDTHQILFGSANSFKNYCVLGHDAQTAIHACIQTDRWIFFCLFEFQAYKTGTFVKRRQFFASSLRKLCFRKYFFETLR